MINSTGRFRSADTVSVRSLCRAAGIAYAMEDGPERTVRLRTHGGHERVKRPGTKRDALYVDVSSFVGSDAETALGILAALALDLGCYEAGESLAMAGHVERLRNGRFARIRATAPKP